MTRTPDVIVIGAGPYGLAATAHLRAIGANVHTIGEPMSFWQQHMPKGMLLRSAWAASHIAHPRAALTLDAFGRARGAPLARPVPIADFVAYGKWFADEVAPDVDRRWAELVEPAGAGFRVRLDDGETITSARVVVAAGIRDFAWRPREFADLGYDLASHSSMETDLGRFTGRRVAVIGGGQSAIESAVLLAESGANVELIMRTGDIHWVGRATRDGLLGRLLFDRSDVGPALVSHVVAHPSFLRRLPARLQRELTRRSLVPGGSGWLKDRMAGVRVTTGRQVLAGTRLRGHAQLLLDDGAEREFDHVLLATGYRVDLRRLRFLDPTLVAKIRTVAGQPVLDAGLQSSVAGLHFLGAPAVHSFGPLVRFVCGTNFSGAALARSVAKYRAPRAQSRADTLEYASSEEAAS